VNGSRRLILAVPLLSFVLIFFQRGTVAHFLFLWQMLSPTYVRSYSISLVTACNLPYEVKHIYLYREVVVD
jgi:hypothetical protein